MLNTILIILLLIGGVALMIYSSKKAVNHSIILATILGVSPLMIGLTLVSLGTDFPEITSSIISSGLGHMDINLGNSIGSVLSQITLIFGLLPFLAAEIIKVKKRDMIITGACLILSLMFLGVVVENNFISRLNGILLVASWPIYIMIIKVIRRRAKFKKEEQKELVKQEHSKKYHFFLAVLAFIGISIGSYITVQSVIQLSTIFSVPEYIMSFFVLAIGTSLPELIVNFVSVNQQQDEIAIGNIIGSCIVDASFSIGIGAMIFPQAISFGITNYTLTYTLVASAIVIAVLAIRKKVERKTGLIFIVMYALSYLLLTLS